MGFSAAIIQRKNLENGHLYTSFWTGIGTGAVLFIIAVFASPFVADFFNNDLVGHVIIISSVSFFIAPLGIVHRSLLTKNLEFKKLAITEIIAAIISGIVAISLAFLGFGVWSLVARGIINSLIAVILLWVVMPWMPSLYFSKKCFTDLFRFGANVMGSGFLNYLRQNVDYIVIGHLMGAASLGYYTLAYTLAAYPSRQISPIVTRVAFPAFSMLQDDNQRLKKGYMKVVSYLSVITIPALAGLVLVAPEFIDIVFGEKWAPAILPLQILCVIGVVNSIAHTVGTIFYAKGRPDIELKLNIVKLPVTTLAVILGSMYGIVGVASSKVFTAGVYFIITQGLANHLIKLTWREYFFTLKPALVGSVIMAFIIGIYQYILMTLHYSNGLNILVSSILVGLVTYFSLLRKMQPELLNDVKNLIRSV